VKQGDAIVAAIRNHITNPPRLYGARPATTFTSWYEPIRERAVARQPQGPDCRLIGNEFDWSRYLLEMLPSLVKTYLVLGCHAKPHIAGADKVPTRGRAPWNSIR
jgi:hypothetical protein